MKKNTTKKKTIKKKSSKKVVKKVVKKYPKKTGPLKKAGKAKVSTTIQNKKQVAKKQTLSKKKVTHTGSSIFSKSTKGKSKAPIDTTPLPFFDPPIAPPSSNHSKFLKKDFFDHLDD